MELHVINWQNHVITQAALGRSGSHSLLRCLCEDSFFLTHTRLSGNRSVSMLSVLKLLFLTIFTKTPIYKKLWKQPSPFTALTSSNEAFLLLYFIQCQLKLFLLLFILLNKSFMNICFKALMLHPHTWRQLVAVVKSPDEKKNQNKNPRANHSIPACHHSAMLF